MRHGSRGRVPSGAHGERGLLMASEVIAWQESRALHVGDAVRIRFNKGGYKSGTIVRLGPSAHRCLVRLSINGRVVERRRVDCERE